MGLAVCQRTQAFIIFLTGCVPESQLYGLSIDTTISNIIFEYRRDISLREKGQSDAQKATLSADAYSWKVAQCKNT